MGLFVVLILLIFFELHHHLLEKGWTLGFKLRLARNFVGMLELRVCELSCFQNDVLLLGIWILAFLLRLKLAH